MCGCLCLAAMGGGRGGIHFTLSQVREEALRDNIGNLTHDSPQNLGIINTGIKKNS